MISGSKHTFLGLRPIAAEDVSLLDNFVISDYRRARRLSGVGFREDRFADADASSLLMARSQRWVVEEVRGGLRRQPNI